MEVLVINNKCQLIRVDRKSIFQPFAHILADIISITILKSGKCLTVKHAPNGTVVKGQFGTDMPGYAIRIAAITDVEEAEVRKYADVIGRSGVFIIKIEASIANPR